MASNSIGDGLVTLSVAATIITYLYVTFQTRQKKLDIIHQERMTAMDKGIPLPEFPLEAAKERRPPDPTVLPILGIVLLTLSAGAMIVMYLNRSASSANFWIAPLPFAFLGMGLFTFHFLKGNAR